MTSLLSSQSILYGFVEFDDENIIVYFDDENNHCYSLCDTYMCDSITFYDSETDILPLAIYNRFSNEKRTYMSIYPYIEASKLRELFQENKFFHNHEDSEYDCVYNLIKQRDYLIFGIAKIKSPKKLYIIGYNFAELTKKQILTIIGYIFTSK
jgi:hypothetical protein